MSIWSAKVYGYYTQANIPQFEFEILVCADSRDAARERVAPILAGIRIKDTSLLDKIAPELSRKLRQAFTVQMMHLDEVGEFDIV